MKKPFDDSAEGDLKQYMRDQERQLFAELEAMQRCERRTIEEKECAAALTKRRLREEQVDKLWPQTYELGRLAGMTSWHALGWAFDCVRKAKQLM
jgi:hypothetical protein